MVCDYCHRDVERLYRHEDEHICRDCLADVRYCASGGRVPQEDA
jgi:hypothetical protein